MDTNIDPDRNPDTTTTANTGEVGIFTRLIRGLLLIAIGVVIGGISVYLWIGAQPSLRGGIADVVAVPAAVDPANPPAQPTGSTPLPGPPVDAPAGQFDSAAATTNANEAPVLDGSRLIIPVQGIQPGQLQDTYSDARGSGRVHDAIDIMAPAGTPVLAAADGKVAKLFQSKLGGTTLYQYDDTGAIVYYYAHLQAYAPGIHEGMAVKRGDVIGQVGSTGNASAGAPHLHFAIMVLGPEKQWWKGSAINPYPLLGGAAKGTTAPTPQP
ncbi:M23 family metallopeptidase [Solilutibacter silvestris]|uniref:Peptidase family M23 n=1 Tax=Solilutibacter silvestris TaxID=1645665 RepID=A0A2K1Q212_9GAMM|nr:M23 family metallopeptidase [Lysobacter silvestris]PNS08987.1 Peptidase family M23 [Lysobacter silvestris]